MRRAMNKLSKTTWTKWALLIAILPTLACGVETGSDEESLTIGGWGPASLAATLMSAYASTAAGATVAWTEHGGNAITILERQTYDLAGNVLGNWQEVVRWTNAPAGSYSYFDAAQRKLVNSKVVIVGGVPPTVVIPPDTQVGYRIVELPPGFTTCVGTTVGTCAYTTTMAYMPKATNYGVGRVQLSLKTTAATANANSASLHVRAKVNPYNETWLDSTHNNFHPGSYLPYDLSTSEITGLQDVQYIDVWTPDADGICVGEVTLTIDNRTAFDQQFSSCVWVMNGSSLHIPFPTIRTNTLWTTYAPDTYQHQSPPVTFIGFDAAGLAAHLDSIVGSKLRNDVSSAGPNAHLGATTTLTRRDPSHMHVQQHLLGIHVVYNQADFGVINADPSYDLVIHHNDPTCSPGWCVHVENFDGGSGGISGGVAAWLITVLGIIELVEYEVNASLTDEFKNTTGLPAPWTFCFPDPNTATPVAAITMSDQNHPVNWGTGSITACTAYIPQD
jgi:hypothetical protein